MPHPGPQHSRAHRSKEGSPRPHVPTGALLLAWHNRRGPRVVSVSYTIVGAIVASVAALCVWGIAVTSYVAFKDDIVGGVMSRQATLQHDYEERIRQLRGQLDRMTSRQMVDQTELERRVDQVMRRQAMLETRQAIVTALKETARQSDPPSRPVAPAPRTLGEAPPPRPLPVGDTVRITPPGERQSRLESRTTLASAAAPGGSADSPTGQQDRMAQVERSLDGVERTQQSLLQNLETRTERRARRIRAMLTELGLAESRLVPLATGNGTAGTGGPLIPLPAPSPEASSFERQVFRIQTVMRDHERLTRLVDSIPVVRPHQGELELSSGFGARLDPFLRTWAMHSGVDFRGSPGEPVFSTASGRVSHAGPLGGYGLLVEVDHGNGLTTRYAHLSRIHVREGELVGVGQRLGQVGSTGRSTGPHLHYETRINGEAVDPMRFLRAGLRLAAATAD